jgi:hypothetical protein
VLAEIRSKIEKFVCPHEMYDRRAAADHVAALHRIYVDHWLSRGLGELEAMFVTPAGMYARLAEQADALTAI